MTNLLKDALKDKLKEELPKNEEFWNFIVEYLELAGDEGIKIGSGKGKAYRITLNKEDY